MALSSLMHWLPGGRRSRSNATGAGRARRLRLEPLENRLALATLMEVKVEATDLVGNPITNVEVGDEFVLVATVQDLRAQPTGVFAAYADVTYDPNLVAVNGDITHGPLYPNGIDGDTSTPGLIDDAGGFYNCTSFPCFGDGDEELLFSVPFIATAAGTVIFDVSDANDPSPVHDNLMFGISGAIALEDIDYVDATLEVTAPSATDLLQNLIAHVQSLEIHHGIQNALESKLNAALEDFTEGNTEGGIEDLESFIDLVESQRGDKLTEAQADFLLDAATTIINAANSEDPVLV